MVPVGVPSDLVAGLQIRGVTSVSGGDIAEAYRLDTADGPLFCKTRSRSLPGLFEHEAAGLRVLAEHAPAQIGVPTIVRATPDGLVLSWIDEGRRGGDSEAEFGRGLAALHRATTPTFGAVDPAKTTGFLGAVRLDQTPGESWPEFYLTRRLVPLVEEAIEAGALDPAARHVLDRVSGRIAELCGPDEPPALVHGDLWGGNRLVDTSGRNHLIDPAAHYAHREIDIAMMHLFGGFGPEVIGAYDEVHPLADGWRGRLDWYQLPAVLVHAVLFGGSYGDAALRTLRAHA